MGRIWLLEVTKMKRLAIVCTSFMIVGLMFAGQGYAQVDPETILGIWLLDEASGDTTEDASGNGHEGTLMGPPAWVAGWSGSALEFSGSSTHVTCGNDPALNVDVFSVSFWCNIPATQAWNHMVSRGSHQGGGNPGAVNWGVMMVSGEETILFEVFNDTGWLGIRAGSSAGEWHHVVATYDGATAELFHDGQSAGTGSGGVLLDESRAFVIGARSDAGAAGGFFNGSLDEVGYFNAILSPEDIAAIMTDGLAGITGTRTVAAGPKPPDGGMNDTPWVMLSWRPGGFAVQHDVYLGESFEQVSAATPDDADVYVGRLGTETLTVGLPSFPYPDGLVPGQTYYWRVDEVNDVHPESPWKGDVWSFRIRPLTAFGPFPVDGMKYVDPNQDLTWQTGTGTIFHTIYFGQSEDEVAGAVAGGWMQVDTAYDPGTLELDTTYYWRIDEFKGATTDKGDVWSFTTRGEGGGVKAEYFAGMDLAGDPILSQIEPTIDHSWSAEVAGGLEDQVSARWRGNLEAPLTEPVRLITTSDDGVRLWVDAQLVIDNWTDHGTTDNTAMIDMEAGHVYGIVMEWYENGGGAVAQLSWESDTLPRQIVPQGWLQLPLHAVNPSPSHGAPAADDGSVLSWVAGDDATGHQVYFGDNAEAVANADTSTAGIYRGQQAAGVTTLNPGPLEWGKTYYWRVDEINPDGVLAGSVWSFTVADFIVIDDFESYTNEIGSRPFEVWIDGVGFSQPEPGHPGNGSNALVGYDIWTDTSPYYNGLLMETQNVHGGLQSMPVAYNNINSPFYSEIERTWAAPQNWTANGVDTLTLHVSGGATNDADRFYVTLTDSSGRSATVDIADTSVLTSRQWSVVNIPLADFAGVNVAAIAKMVVGLGNPPAVGGAGSLLFDDFRVTTSQ
jgi:hypothetical protein